MKASLVIVLICLICTSARAQQAKDITAGLIKAGIVTIGMTKEQVTQAIGPPQFKCPHKDVDIWHYASRRFIYFKNDKVIKGVFPPEHTRQYLKGQRWKRDE